MREIKFRAWNKNNNKMGKVTYLNLDIPWIELDGYSGNLTWGGLNPDCIVMQYTGLKDKNGKEIYEGDIVKDKVNNFVWFYLITTVGSMGNNLFAICKWRNFTVIDGETIIGSYFEGGNWMYILSTVEVIGNIYENPEILEKE